MIRYQQTTEAGIAVVPQLSKGCWIDVVEPSPEQVQKAAELAGVDALAISNSLDPGELPRAVKEDGALFLTVRIPHARGTTAKIPYTTIPLAIILNDDYVVTVCAYEHALLRDLEHMPKTQQAAPQPRELVLQLLWSVAHQYVHELEKIETEIDAVEQRLKKSLQNHEVLDLLRYQKSLVHMTTALRTNELVLERLQRADLLALDKKDQDRLDDIVTENHEAQVMGDVLSDMLGQTMDAFASIISNNLNAVMKFLAAITVILIIPQILGTFYGMNVGLPLGDHPFAFHVMLGLSILLAGLVALYFWRKDWL